MELTPTEAHALAAARERDGKLDPAERKRSGIVHTPPELARFIARAVDTLLQCELDCGGGLADARVSLLDPACGPGAFFAAAHAVAGARAQRPHAVLGLDRDDGAWLAKGALAEQPGMQWPIALRRMDTLEVDPAALRADLSPVVAILGNPPWIGSAQPAAAPWLKRALEELRCDEHGARLQEKKLGVLSDAYVRFLAWAIAVVRDAPGGAVLGLVTNASYLDGPVHRGLRAALRRTFDLLHVVDLGGGALVARAAREGGSADGNVFGVRTPAAVLLAVRKPRSTTASTVLGAVRYARLHGDVPSKLEQLGRVELADTSSLPLHCEAPSHRFTPGRAAPAEYLAWPSLAELMPFHREGVQTNRDAAVVDEDPQRLVQRLTAFAYGRSAPGLEDIERALSHYDPERAREAVRRVIEEHALAKSPAEPHATWLRRIAYRPLDTRWFAPIPPMCHRPRPDLLRAMDASQRAGGFALVTARKDRGAVPWRHIAAVTDVVDNSYLSTRSSCRARAVPTHAPDGSENLDAAVAAALFERAGRSLRVEELACYALAALSSRSYQAKYEIWLRADYPRVPLPRDARAFDEALAAGRRLRALWCESLTSLSETESDAAADALVVGHHRVVERWSKGQGGAACDTVDRGDRVRVFRGRAAALALALSALDR